MSRLALYFLIFGFVFSETAISASYDCKNAKLSKIETLILGYIYHSIIDKHEGSHTYFGRSDAIKTDQLAWLKSRNICSTINCVEEIYIARLKDLISIGNMEKEKLSSESLYNLDSVLLLKKYLPDSDDTTTIKILSDISKDGQRYVFLENDGYIFGQCRSGHCGCGRFEAATWLEINEEGKLKNIFYKNYRDCRGREIVYSELKPKRKNEFITFGYVEGEEKHYFLYEPGFPENGVKEVSESQFGNPAYNTLIQPTPSALAD